MKDGLRLRVATAAGGLAPQKVHVMTDDCVNEDENTSY